MELNGGQPVPLSCWQTPPRASLPPWGLEEIFFISAAGEVSMELHFFKCSGKFIVLIQFIRSGPERASQILDTLGSGSVLVELSSLYLYYLSPLRTFFFSL